MKRQDEGGLGWLVKHKSVAKDEFVPFGFEVGGALGAKAEGFLAECVRVAEWKNQGVIIWRGAGVCGKASSRKSDG